MRILRLQNLSLTNVLGVSRMRNPRWGCGASLRCIHWMPSRRNDEKLSYDTAETDAFKRLLAKPRIASVLQSLCSRASVTIELRFKSFILWGRTIKVSNSNDPVITRVFTGSTREHTETGFELTGTIERPSWKRPNGERLSWLTIGNLPNAWRDGSDE